MTADAKSPYEQLSDVVSQLKEMRHYAKNNVERRTAQWMLFDADLKKLHHTDRIEELMTRQGELHDSLEAEIAALEEVAAGLAPKDDEAGAAGTQH
jgi:C4-dicarboxylate-specific signal transduction histidine kinase